MSAPRFTADDLGCYYQDASGELWMLVTYSDEPTATLERVSSDRQDVAGAPRVGGVVGAPIFDGFRKLVPEAPA